MPAACFGSSQLTAPMSKTTDDCNQNLRNFCPQITESSLVAKESEVFICFFCDERFSDKQHLTQHQDACNLRAFGLETLFKFKRRKLPQNLELQESEHSRERARQRSFLECFDIVSVGRAEALGKRDGKEQIVCDVIVIDDSDEDDAEPELPTPPASPQSLIPSDGKNFKRTSSFSPRSDRKNAVVIKRDNDVIATSRSAEKLLRIDLSSPLGQRLRDHVDMLNRNKSEPREDECVRPSGNDMVVANSANVDSETFVRESPFSDRLRQRGEWQVTFRPSRQQCRSSSHSHVYRFGSRQREEFCRAFDCGLSVRARRLRRQTKPCRVIVPRLPPEVIATYRSNARGSGSASCRNRLSLRIPKSVVSLTKCDYRVTEGTTSDASCCDLSRSEGSECQMVSDHQPNGLSSPGCNTEKPATVHPTSDSSRRLFDGEPFVTATSDAVGENGVELSRQSLRECSSSNNAGSLDTDRSDLLSVNNPKVRNVDENTDDASDHSARSVTAKENSCPQLLDTTAASSNVARNSPVSVRPAKTGVLAADKDGRTVDCGSTDSMAETPTSGWSMSGDLPALSFLCNVCGELVDCELDARSLIYEHYAGHGITNIELMDERTPTGDTVIKLVELPVSTTNSPRGQAPVPSTAADQKSPTKSILVRDRTPARAEGIEFDSGSPSAARSQKKRRRVTWADEVLSHRVPSPARSDTVHQYATLGSPEQRLTSTRSQQAATIFNNGVASTLCSTKRSTISTKSVAPSTPTVVGSNLSSVTVLPVRGESSAQSFPVIYTPDTVPTVARRRHIFTTASRRRARMFWSNSSLRGGETGVDRVHSTTDEHPQTPRRPFSSTALQSVSKRAANGALLSPSTAGAARNVRSADGVDRLRKSPRSLANMSSPGQSPLTDSAVPTRNISFVPDSHRRSRTADIRLNSCRSSYQQETNVICID